MAGRVLPTAAQVTAKWQKNTAAATQAYADGVNAVQDSPMEKAAANSDKMLAKITEAVNSGKWAKTLRAVSLADWKTKTATTGAQRLASGVQAAGAKRAKFDQALINYLGSAMPAIDSMKVITIEDGIAKSAAMIRAMNKFQYRTQG